MAMHKEVIQSALPKFIKPEGLFRLVKFREFLPAGGNFVSNFFNSYI